MSKTNRRRMRKKKHKHNLRVTLYLTRQHPWTLFGNSVTQLPKQPKKKKKRNSNIPIYNRCTPYNLYSCSYYGVQELLLFQKGKKIQL